MKPELMDAYHSNIFLAEDRVLSLALVSKRGCDYYLKFVATSVALTDVPDTLFKLLAQRRRWINGSWFALIDSLREFKKVNKSSHSCFTKFCIYLEMIYFGVNVLFAFLMVGLFFLTFSVLLRNTFPDDTEDKDLFDIGNAFIILYFTILLVVFILSLSTKPIHVNGFYHLISVILGLYMFAIIALMINFFINLDTDDQINLAAGAFPVVGFLIGMILYNSVFIILKGVI